MKISVFFIRGMFCQLPPVLDIGMKMTKVDVVCGKANLKVINGFSDSLLQCSTMRQLRQIAQL